MGATDFSTKARGSKPIIAERAMYWADSVERSTIKNG